MSKNITLTSSDGVKVVVDEKSAQRSGLLKGLIQDYDESSDIAMPDITGVVLNKIVEYLVHYKDSEPRDIPKPLPSANLLEVTDEWDVNFINSVDLDTVFDIIQAANYMDIHHLLHLACSKAASLMIGKTVEELRYTFNIENDLTPEEEAELAEFDI
jgi:S-phase kinase-associated protein 1